MKKSLLLSGLLFFCLQVFSQNALKQIIKGENGISKHFVTLGDKTQVAFVPSQARSQFGLDDQSDLILMNKEQDQIGQTHYRYYQTYQKIPVENTMYIVHTANDKLLGMSGVIITDFSTDMPQRAQAKISAQNAILSAVRFVGAKKYAWQDAAMEHRIKFERNDERATYAPVAKLVWYNTGTQVSSPELRLAFKVDVYAKEPLSRADYFIDAQTGKVLGKKDKLQHVDAIGTANTEYSGSKQIHSDKFNTTTYRLRDITRGNGVLTLHGDVSTANLDYTSTSANWVLSGQARHAMDVHYGVEQTYTFYKTRFNRNSLDNNGLALISYVNDGEIDNAHWDGTSMNFGIRSGTFKGVTGIDVTGHELTHGLTQYTSGLVYSDESGAMNESMSDIMGKSVQFFAKPADLNWQLSNDMGWIIRDMKNPNAYGQPDTYFGTDWYSGTSDHGGVHTNSGVGNFMYYLLVTGGTGTNDYGYSYNVTGIGLVKAAAIIYRTETVYLTPTSQYTDWKAACIQAATDLYGAASNEVTQVKNAWFAVGVGNIYCLSEGQSTFYEYINRVAFANINNTSGNNNGFGDYTNLTANVVKGQAYPITLVSAFPNGATTIYWTVYIDYNHDGDFNDANEAAAVATQSTAGAITRYISIPSNAATAKTFMLVQMADEYDVPSGPCYSAVYGESEYYSVNMTAALKPRFNDAPLSAVAAGKPGISVNPNPVTSGSNATVNYTIPGQGKITLKVVDLYGRIVQRTEVGLQSKGSHTYNLDFAKALASGNYYVVIEQDNKLIGTTKMLVTQNR